MYPDVTPKDIYMLQQVIGGSIYYQGYPNWGLPPFVYWGHYVGKNWIGIWCLAVKLDQN